MVRREKPNNLGELRQIAEAATSIVKEDVRSITLIHDSLPPPIRMLDNINDKIPEN